MLFNRFHSLNKQGLIQSVSKRSIKFYSTLKDDNSNKNYSDTLLLPETSFKLRFDPLMEKKYREKSTTEVYQWQLKKENRPNFILHDGPPYANGKLHSGHAMNKILKDIINRYKLLQGYKVNYIPGWDCHGLPIELKALEKFKKQKLTPVEIRKEARKLALETIETQKEDFKKFGIMADWNQVYRTLDTDYIVRQLNVFKKFIEKGYVYRQFRPVYWSPSTLTALAESELEYKNDHKSTAAYIKFNVEKNHSLFNTLPKEAEVNVIIWTTTPWTIPSNQAISVHPEINYGLFKEKNVEKYFIIGEKGVENVKEFMNSLELVKIIKGKELELINYYHPINKEKLKIILADYVSETSGTGLVHCAPSHGMDDYRTGQKYGITGKNLVDQYGKFTSEAGELLAGKAVLREGNTLVLGLLKESNNLINSYDYIHSYPYDWRSKKPVIQRATAQWFINVQQITKNAINKLNQVTTIPSSGKNRLIQFLNGREEWCISRQRSWGVPIPVFYDKNGNPLLDNKVITHVINIIKEKGVDSWFELSVKELLPLEYDSQSYTKGMDTMDVWFDSGTSFSLIEELKENNNINNDINNNYISDVYLEGSDQHRGWFQSSILLATGAYDKLPYKTLITHGFLLDGKGIKMSKSIGNIIEPQIIIEGGKNKQYQPAYGIDLLRFWIASSDYSKDVSLGNDILKMNNQALFKVRNTIRFILGNVKTKREISYKQLFPLDQYILHELFQLQINCQNYYEDYQFHLVIAEILKFSNFLSSFYLDSIKDRVYAEKIESQSRTNVEYVLLQVLETYLSLLAPITPLMIEEAYDLSKQLLKDEKESVFHREFVKLNQEFHNVQLKQEWEIILQIKQNIYSSIEKFRIENKITNNLQLRLNFYNLNKDMEDWLLKLELNHHQLSDVLLISDIQFKQTEDLSELNCFDIKNINDSNMNNKIYFQLQKIENQFKCPRCWKYHSLIENQLCQRCDQVIKY